MASSAQSLITTAVSLGYDALSDRDLKECLLVAAQVGTGGALTGTGSPVGVVVAFTAGQFYVDLANPAAPNFWVSTGSGTGNWTELIGT